jgi:hypothetical protein
MYCRFANFQNGETDPSTGQVHASPCVKLDKNDFIEGGFSKFGM